MNEYLCFIVIITVAIQKAMSLQEKYGSPFRFWLMHKPFIVINAPEDFEVQTLRYCRPASIR